MAEIMDNFSMANYYDWNLPLEITFITSNINSSVGIFFLSTHQQLLIVII